MAEDANAFFMLGLMVGFAIGVFIGAWLEYRAWTEKDRP